MKENKLKKVHIIIILVGIVFANLSIFHSNLWFDESYSVGMASRTFIDIWNIGGHDVHPVLYYWILHIIALITNNSILAYRIFSGIMISLTGILGFTHIRKDFGEKTGLIFSFLIYFSPVSAVFGAQIRMYSLAMFLVTVLAIYAYRLSKESKISYWIIFFIASIASIYTHYYSLMAAGLINLFLLISFIKNKQKKSYITQIILGILQCILFLPWLIYFSSQLSTMSSNGFWISITFPDTLIQILGFQFSGNLSIYLGLVISIFVYGYCIYLLIKTKENKPAILAISVYIAVILVALFMSLVLGQDILYYRYLFVLTGIVFFAISYLLSKGKNVITLIICAIILITGIVNNAMQITENYDSSNQEPMQFIEDNIEEGDIIVFQDIGSGSVVAVNFPEYKQYFYNGANWGVGEAYKAFGYQMDTVITTDFLEECTGRTWIITSGGTFYEKYFDNENYELLLNENFQTAYEDYYYEIHLVQYVGEK